MALAVVRGADGPRTYLTSALSNETAKLDDAHRRCGPSRLQHAHNAAFISVPYIYFQSTTVNQHSNHRHEVAAPRHNG